MYQELLRKIAEENQAIVMKKSSGYLTIWEILLQKFAMILFLQALLEGFREEPIYTGTISFHC